MAAPGSPSHGRSAICRMYTDVQASGSIQDVLSMISTPGTRCCWASANAEMTTASARTTASVSPDRRTHQVNTTDHRPSPVRAIASHQPEIRVVSASTATAVNRTEPPRRRAIAYQPASRCRARSDGPPKPGLRARLRSSADSRICPPTESAAGSTGPVFRTTPAPGMVTFQPYELLLLVGAGKYPWPVFSPDGPSARELAVQALSSVEGGYDRLAPKFDCTPFRTSGRILDATADALRPLGPFGRGVDVGCGTRARRPGP